MAGEMRHMEKAFFGERPSAVTGAKGPPKNCDRVALAGSLPRLVRRRSPRLQINRKICKNSSCSIRRICEYGDATKTHYESNLLQKLAR